MENDKVFVNGLRVSMPRPNSPDFVKLEFGAKVDEFIQFLQAYKKADGWVNFTLKKSKGGKLYLELNDFNKEGAPQQPQRPAQPSYNAPSPDEDYSLQDEVLPEINTGRPEDDSVDIKDIPF